MTSASDSDSDYGSRSKKRKRPRSSGEELRVSSRAGGRIPNYLDDVQDFEKYEDDEAPSASYQPVEQEHVDEIEAVLSHSRDEGREGDSEDRWDDNIVSEFFKSIAHTFNAMIAISYQVEGFLASSQHR